jgi:hypothetical protein
VTLCEVYLGIDPDLDLWKYFFHVRCPQDPKVELTTSGSAVMHVKLGHITDLYPEIPVPRSMKLWRKKWFYPKAAVARGVDRDSPPVDVLQSPDPTTSDVKDEDVGVSRAQLPRPSLPRRAERG